MKNSAIEFLNKTIKHEHTRINIKVNSIERGLSADAVSRIRNAKHNSLNL
jgi:hypothetical protein